MSRLLLKTDDAREIVLEAPRTAAWALAAALAAVASALYLLAPGLRIAPVVLGFFALWMLSEALRIHRLRLDLVRGDYVYRRGFALRPPRRRGDLGEIAGVFVDRHDAAGGLAASRLRSRVVTLEFAGWPAGEGAFVIGFPMAPRVAADRAAGYARRLGVEVVDRATATDRW